jgi:hypothetical protein
LPKVFFWPAGLVASNVADIVNEPIRWVLPVRVVVVEVECRGLPEQKPYFESVRSKTKFSLTVPETAKLTGRHT